MGVTKKLSNRNTLVSNLFLVLMIFFGLILPLPIKAEENHRNLTFTLLQEGKFNEAATEARRSALAATNVIEKSAYLFLAAYAYSATQDFERATKMLDRSEDIYPPIKENALFLRGKIAMEQFKYEEALFYFQTLLPIITNQQTKTFVMQEIAVSQFIQSNTNALVDSLKEMEISKKEAILKELKKFNSESDKNPKLGGVLGLIPGLGYAYAKEYDNALRCLILNGIFISAMVYSASEGQWGAFAVISFFELTWYSGSIYGGIDAAHRYNKKRRDKVLTTIRGAANFDGVNFSAFPKISLQFNF